MRPHSFVILDFRKRGYSHRADRLLNFYLNRLTAAAFGKHSAESMPPFHRVIQGRVAGAKDIAFLDSLEFTVDCFFVDAAVSKEPAGPCISNYLCQNSSLFEHGVEWQAWMICPTSTTLVPARRAETVCLSSITASHQHEERGSDLRSMREKRKRAALVQIASAVFETYFPLRLMFIDWQSHLSCTELPFLGTT